MYDFSEKWVAPLTTDAVESFEASLTLDSTLWSKCRYMCVTVGLIARGNHCNECQHRFPMKVKLQDLAIAVMLAQS